MNALPPAIPTHVYSRYCGPGALSAIAGITRLEAAGLMRRITRRLGWPLNTRTYPGVLETAIIETGFTLEAWSVSRSPVAIGPVAAMASAEVSALVGPSPRHVEYHAAVVPPERAAPNELSVSDWLTLFPVGTWVLHVDQHVIAARGGVLVAGDDDGRWNDSALRDAWRVVPGA
jgi:hypothetical protein